MATKAKTDNTPVGKARAKLAEERSLAEDWAADVRTCRDALALLDEDVAKIDALDRDELDDEAKRIARERSEGEAALRLAEQAEANARGRILVAQRAVLEACAAEEDKAAEKAAAELAAHRAKVDQALAELKALDGADYEPARVPDRTLGGESSHRQSSTADRKATEVRKYEMRAAAIRHYLATGERPVFVRDLRRKDGSRFAGATLSGDHLSPDARPACLSDPELKLSDPPRKKAWDPTVGAL